MNAEFYPRATEVLDVPTLEEVVKIAGSITGICIEEKVPRGVKAYVPSLDIALEMENADGYKPAAYPPSGGISTWPYRGDGAVFFSAMRNSIKTPDQPVNYDNSHTILSSLSPEDTHLYSKLQLTNPRNGEKFGRIITLQSTSRNDADAVRSGGFRPDSVRYMTVNVPSSAAQDLDQLIKEKPESLPVFQAYAVQHTRAGHPYYPPVDPAVGVVRISFDRFMLPYREALVELARKYTKSDITTLRDLPQDHPAAIHRRTMEKAFRSGTEVVIHDIRAGCVQVDYSSYKQMDPAMRLGYGRPISYVRPTRFS